MDSQLYFPDAFAFIHAPVPLNTQAFDVAAFSVQENEHAQAYAPLPIVATFPTPSELMVDLASSSHDMNMINHHAAPLLEDLGFISGPHPSTMQMGDMGNVQYGSAPAPVVPGDHLVHPGAVTVESARRTRRRATMTTVSATHGSTFVPTDPDTISSHEKKRHYLECIEQYIQFLHEQFHLLGEHPPEMERVGSYRGLSSRSIRTLLVHMEHNTRKLTERTRDEEQRFISLRNEIHSKELEY